MGFIERLRQHKEVEARIRRQVEDTLLATKQAEDAIKQQKEAQEREFHSQRQQKASLVQQESGVSILIEQFRKFRPASDSRIGINTKDCDLDSSLDTAAWGGKKIGTSGVRISSEGPDGFPAQFESIDVYEMPFIIIESHPDGDIIFHGKYDIKVRETEWRNNKNILESALEQVYAYPRLGESYSRPLSSYSDG